MKRVITGEMVVAEFKAGRRSIAAPRAETIITPAAWSKGRELGVTFDQSKSADFGTSIADVIDAGDGTLLTVGEAGAVRITLP